MTAANRKRAIYVIFVLALTLRLVYAFLNPVYNAPDEQSHFKYVNYLVQEGHFPKALSKVGAPTNDWEYYQPPLYYLVSVPILSVFDSIYSLRVFSVVLSMGVILLIYLSFGSLLAAGFAAFLPTYIGLSASINNDNLLIFFFTLLFFLILKNYKNPFVLGVLCGALFLTKYPGLIALLFVAGLFLYERKFKHFFLTSATAFVLIFPWLLRNQTLYGSWLAMEVANEASNLPFTLRNFAWVLKGIVHTFWMIFGIYNNQAFYFDSNWLLGGYVVLFGVLSICLLRGFFRVWLGDNQTYKLFCVLGAVFVALTLMFAFHYRQPQGRFLYPVLLPLSLFWKEGFEALKQDAKFLKKSLGNGSKER